MSDLASEIVDAIARKIFRVVLTTQTDRDWLEAVIRSGLESHTERVRLLEAVAEAARAEVRAWMDYRSSKETSFAEYLAKYQMSDNVRAVLEALAALGAYDE